MEKQKMELKKLDEEIKYLNVEYKNAMYLNKRAAILDFMEEIKLFFRRDECDVTADFPMELEIKKRGNICRICSPFDYQEEPETPIQLSISVTSDQGLVSEKFVRFITSESSGLNFNLSALGTNPYEGMNSDEIEIYERKKDISYMRKYINGLEEPEKSDFYCFDKVNETTELHKSIASLYEKEIQSNILS